MAGDPQVAPGRRRRGVLGIAREMRGTDGTRNSGLRMLYFSGPVDALAVYRRWRDGLDDEQHVAVIYLRQFLEVHRRIGARSHVFSSRPKATGHVNDRSSQLSISYRPVPWGHHGTPGFLLGRTWAGLRILALALRHRADVVIVTEAHTFWFLLLPLHLVGVRVIASIHCVLWPRHRPMPRLRRLLNPLDGYFFRRACDAVLVVSDEIAQQIRQVAGDDVPIRRFVPSYPAGAFAGIEPPDPERRPFRVLFAGRMVRDKGIYDLFAVARALADAGRTDIVFHLCGDGPELPAIRAVADEAGLGERFVCHGFMQREAMRVMYGRSHIVIAPTATSFVEGFNKVVLEGVLAGRPVITSSTCPALSDVREAVVEVPPDDVDAYRAAIEKLCDDRSLYEEKRQHASIIRERFLEDQRTWENCLLGALVKADIR